MSCNPYVNFGEYGPGYKPCMLERRWTCSKDFFPDCLKHYKMLSSLSWSCKKNKRESRKIEQYNEINFVHSIYPGDSSFRYQVI